MSTLREDQENLNRAARQLGRAIFETFRPALERAVALLERMLR
jgi:hypothetical protein